MDTYWNESFGKIILNSASPAPCWISVNGRWYGQFITLPYRAIVNLPLDEVTRFKE